MYENQDELKNFQTKLAILADILGKKKAALLDVLAISENQESLYASPATPKRRDFLMEMGKEKQNHIDTVLQCDEVFQGIFQGISETFTARGKEFGPEVKLLQDGIHEVLQLDIKIRAQEEKVKAAAAAAWAGIGRVDAETGEPIVANKNYILEQYKNNNRTRPR
ncbi:MAG: hypothetical protein FWB74_02795 [Defluviitaleaceae bacterium]|nr:hypothetical protein [Defluviitaleaceae bacterium]